MTHNFTHDIDALLDRVEHYCAEKGMSVTTFGRLAVNDGKFIPRLKSGGRCWPEAIEKCDERIASHPLPSSEDAA